MLVYTYVEVSDPTDECYKYSRKLEMQCFQQKVVDQINASWRATKRTIDIDADRKLEKNQTRLEFYSFTGNYGIAIILLTVIFKVLFFPLTVKSMKSMKAMQA